MVSGLVISGSIVVQRQSRHRIRCSSSWALAGFAQRAFNDFVDLFFQVIVALPEQELCGELYREACAGLVYSEVVDSGLVALSDLSPAHLLRDPLADCGGFSLDRLSWFACDFGDARNIKAAICSEYSLLHT